jgi:basic membrane protein A
MCVGLVTDVGQVDDKSFNQSAWEGVQKAADEMGAEVDYIETQAAKDYATNIGLFAESGCDVIVTVGFALGEATAIAAAEYPDVDFIGVDQFQGAAVDGVAGLIFPEDQAGFLAGALAASMSQSGIIAEVLGTDLVPPVVAFGEGYVNGAKHVNPDIKVIKTYHPGGLDTAFTDPEWGATTARQALENGADVVFGAGGKTGNGALIEVAGEEGALCIGVDTDQWDTVPEAQPCLITSSMKMIVAGVFDLISQSAAGSMPSGNYGGAVGLAPFHDFDSMVSDDIKSMLATLKADLESGAMSACVWDADSNPACSAGDPEVTAGFDGTTIKIGIINDSSGPAAIIGKPLQAGVATYYEWVNSQGGIAGKYPVELVEADSTYNPSVAVQAYNDMKDDIAIVGNLFGTPVVTALLESLNEDGLMAVPASLDSAWVRESNLIPWGAPYQVQVINGIDWWLNEGGGSTDQVYCSLIQDDPYGEAGQAGLEWIAPKAGITITETARYVSGDADFSAQIGQLQGSGCEVVWLTALPSAVGGIGGAAAGAGFAPTWIGQSPVWINVFAASALAPYLQENLVIIGEGGTWGDTSMPGAVAMMERMATYAPDQEPDYYFAAGYVMAMASAGALEQAVANGDLSREGILQASTQMSVDYEGLSGDYQYGQVDERQPATANTIFRVNPEVPNGVEAVVIGYESEYASDYDF